MKKKKNLAEQLFGWTLLIIAFMFSGYVVYLGISIIINEEPHFKITKEDCRNETIECEVVDTKLNENGTLTYTYICPQYYVDTSKNISKIGQQICEQVEINEMILDEVERCLNQSITETSEELFCETFSTKILNQDLTIEWLEENCGLPYNYKVGDERYKEEVNYYYDCGDYQVEVLK